MYYKILKDTELFNSIMDLNNKAIECDAKAWAIVERLQGTGITRSDFYYAGGFCGIQLKQKPDGWKDTDSYGYYFPKRIKENKALLLEIDSLPTIDSFEMKRIVGLDMISGYRMAFKPDYILFSPNHPINHKPDMVEILGSEFELLYKSEK